MSCSHCRSGLRHSGRTYLRCENAVRSTDWGGIDETTIQHPRARPSVSVRISSDEAPPATFFGFPRHDPSPRTSHQHAPCDERPSGSLRNGHPDPRFPPSRPTARRSPHPQPRPRPRPHSRHQPHPRVRRAAHPGRHDQVPLPRVAARSHAGTRSAGRSGAIRPSWIEIDGATLTAAWGCPNARKRSWQRGDVGFVCSSGTTSREGAPARLILVTDKSHGEAITATIVCDGFSYEAYATHARSEPHYHAASRDRSGFRSGRDGTAESPDATCPRGRGGAVARSADGARCRRPVHLAVLGADRRTGDVGAALPRPHHRTIRSGILRVVHGVLTEPPATAPPRVSARRRRCRSGGRAERMRSR